MKTPRIPLAVLVGAVIALTISTTLAQLGRGRLVAKRLITGLARPVFVTAPPGDSDRIFVVEKRFSTGNTGRIQIHNRVTGAPIATFLSIGGVNTANEEGLLGLAFHPNYDTNGHFYVYFSDNIGGRITRIVRYTANGSTPFLDATTANAVSAMEVLRFSQPQGNHNGGWIGFDPTATGDARYYLYIASGDGGGGDDNDAGHTANIGNAQDITSNLLGKILRIDVGANGTADDFPSDANKNHAIPSSNPFSTITGDDEIWSYGLRNPWRCSFDRETGDLWIADVGQNAREEVNVQPAGSAGGENYGWRLREGEIATPTPTNNPVGGNAPAGAIEPIIDYPAGNPPSGANETELTDNHEPTGTTREFRGDSVTGGSVYRGRIQWLRGAYLFGDFVSNRFWSLRYNGTTITETLQLNNDASLFELDPSNATFNNYASISEDDNGEIYICTQPQNGASDTAGTVFVITQKPFFLYRSTFFSGTQLDNDAVSGLTADADNDNHNTVEEFLFNMNPVVPDHPDVATSFEDSVNGDSPGEQFLTLTIEISEEAKETATYGGRSGSDLSQLSSATVISAFDPPDSTTLKVQDTVPVSSAGRRFLQIEATIPASELSEDPEI
ncbi:MAG: PQQ-dependent sugar dehydrogenase [Verrucomicrobiota bacterium]